MKCDEVNISAKRFSETRRHKTRYNCFTSSSEAVACKDCGEVEQKSINGVHHKCSRQIFNNESNNEHNHTIFNSSNITLSSNEHIKTAESKDDHTTIISKSEYKSIIYSDNDGTQTCDRQKFNCEYENSLNMNVGNSNGGHKSSIANSSHAFDICPLLTLCALDIICVTAMGKCANAQMKKDSAYVRAVYGLADFVNLRQRELYLWPEFMFRLFGPWKEYQKCLETIHGFSRSVIKERISIGIQG